MAPSAHLDRSTVSFGWDRNHDPAAVVASGTELFVEAPDCSNGQISATSTLETFTAMDLTQLDPISGPVFVEGAHPGDVLKVEILRVAPLHFGWSAVYPGTGLLQEEFPDAWFRLWDLTQGDSTELVPGIRVPIEPMLGIIGCTPAADGPHPSVPPHRAGGNMDMKHAREGTVMFLPVEVEGALFGLGDSHAAQGDGEVGGAGIETPADITVRLSVVRDRVLRFPEYEINRPLERASAARAGYYATTGVGPDLYQAAQAAVRAMVHRVVALYRIEEIEAYMLCSVAADLKISEIVNEGTYVISAFLPRDLFLDPPRE
ncbi:acetamidase/formamidase family protein [Glaciibacter psychrotolerans]|nr:acetamidase/formamidase family protein [Leifsonia psychrotolerans]